MPSVNSSGIAEHVIDAEADAGPLRVGLAQAQPGVGQRPLGRGHAHLALAAHHLQALADRLFLLLVQRAEVVDLAGELPGLGAEPTGRPPAGRRRAVPRRFGPGQRFPQGLFAVPKGLMTPMPVMTTRRGVEVMESPWEAAVQVGGILHSSAGGRRERVKGVREEAPPSPFGSDQLSLGARGEGDWQKTIHTAVHLLRDAVTTRRPNYEATAGTCISR